MAKRKKRRDYSTIGKDCYNGGLEPDRKRILAKIDIDYSVFQKDSQERKTLKWLKAQVKNK